jgi:hypothetical protein
MKQVGGQSVHPQGKEARKEAERDEPSKSFPHGKT